jgi:uncharacterized protein (DUF488 family)
MSKMCIYTVGYEGKDQNKFFNNIMNYNIKTLVDVRKNAISRKYGFSKKQLLAACKNRNISYIHLPELGIPSDLRKSLKTQYDYVKLFEFYESNILPRKQDTQNELIKIIENGASALMCFESDPLFCHRTYLAKSISKQMNRQVRDI